jgi:hypothetical protein
MERTIASDNSTESSFFSFFIKPSLLFITVFYRVLCPVRRA